MPFINCEINLILTWLEHCVISSANGTAQFAITDTKFYVPVVTLSAQDNMKLLKQLDSGSKRITNSNKYQYTLTQQESNRYLHNLNHPSFKGLNRFFVLSFENKTYREVHTGYYLPKVEIKNYNVMIDGKNLFDQPVKMI